MGRPQAAGNSIPVPQIAPLTNPTATTETTNVPSHAPKLIAERSGIRPVRLAARAAAPRTGPPGPGAAPSAAALSTCLHPCLRSSVHPRGDAVVYGGPSR